MKMKDYKKLIDDCLKADVPRPTTQQIHKLYMDTWSKEQYINDKLDKLLKEQYPEQKEKYDLEKVQDEMMKLKREEAVDNLVNKTFDTDRE